MRYPLDSDLSVGYRYLTFEQLGPGLHLAKDSIFVRAPSRERLWAPGSMPGVGGGGTPYDGLYGEALPERGTFSRLQVYKRVGISWAEVYERVGKSDV